MRGCGPGASGVCCGRSLLRLRRSVYGGEHRRELDDRLDFDLVSLDEARGPAGKVCRTVVREHLEVRVWVIVGDAVFGGGVQTPKMQISTSRVSRVLYLSSVSAGQTVWSAGTAKR